MQFNTSDFALWSMEEYTRPDGSKPEIDKAALANLQVFCGMAYLFSKKYEAGEVTTDIDPETESLIITFSSEGVGSGRLVLDHVFVKNEP